MSVSEETGGRTQSNEGLWPSVIFVLAWLLLFMIFSHDVVSGLKWFVSVLMLLWIPGYALLTWLWPSGTRIERIALAPFIGFGITPFLMFIFSQLGVHAVSVWFTLLIAGIFIIVIIVQEHAGYGKTKIHHRGEHKDGGV